MLALRFARSVGNADGDFGEAGSGPFGELGGDESNRKSMRPFILLTAHAPFPRRAAASCAICFSFERISTCSFAAIVSRRSSFASSSAVGFDSPPDCDAGAPARRSPSMTQGDLATQGARSAALLAEEEIAE